MKWAFWGGGMLVLYTYVGYPVWLWLRARWSPAPVLRSEFTPSVSVVMVVRNEEAVLRQKLANLLQLNYPAEKLEVVVVSDGSTDGTHNILSEFGEEKRLRSIAHPNSRGKAAGLNDAIAAARGEIVIFTDARQRIEQDALRVLVENFADPDVGCVSGELMLGDPVQGESEKGLGMYWRVEKKIRELESASGSVIGATGAFYAARRELLSPVPDKIILDDVYIPLSILRRRKRVLFDARARAWDAPDLGSSREFARKVRTLSGNYQLVQLAPWSLTAENPERFQFVSHKLLRLFSPFALAALLVSSFFLPQPIYRVALIAQLVLYGLSLTAFTSLALGPLTRVADAALTFVVLNTAALVAFANFVTGRKVAWTR
ncbi:MAG TPA: glycosyltransferase family 2 protein [Candidatus Sulfotelmatobacter sp.]|nr:glycosyltransferase family 2 protein [Candidatus Sulfotelmatobacter sp.]